MPRGVLRNPATGPATRWSTDAGRVCRRLRLLALVLVAGLACAEAETPAQRVLLVGVDGASLRVTQPLIRAGRLPNFARIAREGVTGPLRSSLPLFSPRIWTSIATGKSAEKHGIRSFGRADEEGVVRIFLSHHRRSHALWNIASDRGLRVAVVNWWTTHPPEKINGVMVSDHMSPQELQRLMSFLAVRSDDRQSPVFPASWQERVRELLAATQPLTSLENPFQPGTGLPPWVAKEELAERFRLDQGLVRIALEIEAELRPDLLMILLPGVDRASHFLWGNLEPEELYPETLRPTAAARAAGREALYRYYEFTDALLGLLVERFGPDDLVLVVSDHGFEPGAFADRVTGIHRSEAAREGVVFARGRGIRRGAFSKGVSIYDVTPTVLAWLGLPVAQDMDGAPAAFLEAPAPSRIASYDTTPIQRVGEASPGAQERLLEELRSLGYLEESP